jgi:ABC-type amino acid transport substrate-binding protein
MLLCVFGVGMAEAEKVRIGVFLHSPIVMQNAPDEEPYGPGVDYAKAVARALGYEPVLSLLPVARILSYLRSGELDMSLEFGMIEERKSYLLYPDTHCLVTQPALTVLADNPLASISSVRDVAGLRIGYILGAYPGHFFDDAKDVFFDHAPGTAWIAQNIGKLLAGRIDAILDQNEFSCLEEARRQGVEDRVKVLTLPVEGFRSYVVFSRASPKGERLLRAYNALEKTGDLDENALLRAYLGRIGR